MEYQRLYNTNLKKKSVFCNSLIKYCWHKPNPNFHQDRMSLVSHWFLSSSVLVSPVIVDVVIDVAASVAFLYAAVVFVFTFDHAVNCLQCYLCMLWISSTVLVLLVVVVAVDVFVVVVFSNVVESLTLRFLCRVHLLGTFQQFPQSFTYIFVSPKVQ